MKLISNNTVRTPDERMSVIKKQVPSLDSSWHYHSKYELLYISSSKGIRFVGDSVSRFSPGDLVLVGPYLPHLWRNDPSYYKSENANMVKTIVIKFTKDFIGAGSFDYPEFSTINDLLKRSKYGVSFGKEITETLHDELIELSDLSPVKQSINLLNVLYRLSISANQKVLSTTDMRQYSISNTQRFDRVIKYISNNYDNYISLSDVADIACMTTSSFCRFFKKMTNKSFSTFLNEVRIRNASRLLVQQEIPVSDACYMVGYKSISNFNRHFKEIMGSSPNDFRRAI